MASGISVRSPKAGSHVNGYQPPRLPLEAWFHVTG
jgi:hypothetical protein